MTFHKYVFISCLFIAPPIKGSEKWGHIVARKYLPAHVVAWLSTQLLPEEIAHQCDSVFKDHTLQKLFQQLIEIQDKTWFTTKKKLEQLGCIFLKALPRGATLIFMHKHIPNLVFKFTCTFQLDPNIPVDATGRAFLVTIGRVWFKNLLEQIAQKHGFDHLLQFPHKWVYCMKYPSYCTAMALMTVAQKIDCSYSHPIREEQMAALLILKKEGKFTDWNNKSEHNVGCHDTTVALFDTEPHNLLKDFLAYTREKYGK